MLPIIKVAAILLIITPRFYKWNSRDFISEEVAIL